MIQITLYYSADLSEKVLRGHTENALHCKCNGGTLPIGFFIDKDKHYQLDPLTAPLVRQAFESYAEGKMMHEIAEDLNRQGVVPHHGKRNNVNTVSNMLQNRKYIGEYRYRDIVVPDGIPRIVTDELFNRVQEQLTKNKKAPARHKAEDDYILSTKLFCGKCGSMMFGESGTSGNKEVHHYYKCVSVYDDRIVITFNYKNETKTISMDELNRSDLIDSPSPVIQLLLGVCLSRYLFHSNTPF